MNILELSDVLNDISDFVNGCLGPLGANGLSNIATYAVDLGVQLCSTLIIFLLVRFLLWKPITKMLEQKRAEADKELEEAHAANENAKAIEAELKKQMAEAQIEVKSILDSAEMLDVMKLLIKQRLRLNIALMLHKLKSIKKSKISNTKFKR